MTLILGQTAKVTLIGCAVGIGLSLALMRLSEGLLFVIAPSDPVVLVTATLLLLGVALAAASLPGRRTARTNPLETLQDG